MYHIWRITPRGDAAEPTLSLYPEAPKPLRTHMSTCDLKQLCSCTAWARPEPVSRQSYLARTFHFCSLSTLHMLHHPLKLQRGYSSWTERGEATSQSFAGSAEKLKTQLLERIWHALKSISSSYFPSSGRGKVITSFSFRKSTRHILILSKPMFSDLGHLSPALWLSQKTVVVLPCHMSLENKRVMHLSKLA